MKNRKLYLLSVFLLILLGCKKTIKGSGKLVEKQLKLEDFNTLILSVPGTVYLTQGKTLDFKIKTDDNILENTKFEVLENKLNIKSDFNLQPTKMDIYISMPNIRKLKILGSGKIIAKSKINSPKLVSIITGSGKMELSGNIKISDIFITGSGNVNFDKLISESTHIDITGSGKVNLKGECTDLKIDITGSGNINALDFPNENCTISIAGSGNLKTNSSKSLKININGSGKVKYKGTPKISSKINGSGSVSKY
jgi:carbon monoxide dehydrogenase subunit G